MEKKKYIKKREPKESIRALEEEKARGDSNNKKKKAKYSNVRLKLKKKLQICCFYIPKKDNFLLKMMDNELNLRVDYLEILYQITSLVIITKWKITANYKMNANFLSLQQHTYNT